LRTQEEEIKQRDAEVNRLLGELRKSQAELLVQQVITIACRVPIIKAIVLVAP
jgi:hypothetical protein